VAHHYKISKLPTLLLFKPGSSEPAARYEGLLSAQDLDLWIKKHTQ